MALQNPKIDVVYEPNGFDISLQSYNVSDFVSKYIASELNKKFIGYRMDSTLKQEMQYCLDILLYHLVQAGFIEFDFSTNMYECCSLLPNMNVKEYYLYYLLGVI